MDIYKHKYLKYKKKYLQYRQYGGKYFFCENDDVNGNIKSRLFDDEDTKDCNTANKALAIAEISHDSVEKIPILYSIILRNNNVHEHLNFNTEDKEKFKNQFKEALDKTVVLLGLYNNQRANAKHKGIGKDVFDNAVKQAKEKYGVKHLVFAAAASIFDTNNKLIKYYTETLGCTLVYGIDSGNMFGYPFLNEEENCADNVSMFVNNLERFTTVLENKNKIRESTISTYEEGIEKIDKMCNVFNSKEKLITQLDNKLFYDNDMYIAPLLYKYIG